MRSWKGSRGGCPVNVLRTGLKILVRTGEGYGRVKV